jgi:ubiquitin carboxyl-terminal hydrolase L5
MNIIMNAQTVKLGPELEEFRNRTKALPPPHRGHALDTNDFIRAIHNSVARYVLLPYHRDFLVLTTSSRNDLVSEDLLLDNRFEAASKRKKAPTKKKKVHKSRKRSYEPGTFHYIAFVPVDGQVWELDGLETMPLCLGKLILSYLLHTSTHYSTESCAGPYAANETDSWLNIASKAIQMRMSRQDDEFLNFNLLAICQSPLLTISQDLATSLATAKALDDVVVTGSPSWDDDVPTPWTNFPDDRLARFNLTRDHILTQCSPRPSFDAQISDPAFNLAAAQKLAEELRVEQEALEAQYVAELATVDEAVDMISGRQRDYTPAVHQWLRILAEKGVLRELIQESNSRGC